MKSASPTERATRGLDQHKVRLWHPFHRHTVLSMCAQALLAIAAAQPALPGSDPPAAAAGQPAAWRDTGKLPASADDQPPRRRPRPGQGQRPRGPAASPRLATAPISRAARDLGYTSSRWRRRHQARARWHHYHARLTATHVT